MSRYWNDFKTIDISEDELCHFGVLGMKRDVGLEAYESKEGIAYSMAMIDFYKELYSNGLKPRFKDKTYYI